MSPTANTLAPIAQAAHNTTSTLADLKAKARGVVAGAGRRVNVTTATVPLSSGYEIPQVALGVYKAPNDGTTEQAVKWAFEAGYRHIDSAARYNNEEAVGKAVKDFLAENPSVKREELFITTKLWDADHGYDKTKAAIDLSLRKLQLDYVDLYLIHSPAESTEERLASWRAMEEAVEAGKIKSIGLSNFDIPHIDELLAVARVKPVVNQIERHPFFAHDELSAGCLARGIRLQAYSPLAQGTKIEDERIGVIALKHNKTPAQIMIRWSIQRGNIVLPKSLTKSRIESNADVFDFELDADDMEVLNALDNGHKVGKLGPKGTSA